MKQIKEHKAYITLAAMAVVTPFLVGAADESGKLLNPLADGRGLEELLVFLIKDIVVGMIAPIAIVLALLWSGFMFIQAQGNDTKLADARRNFLYVVIGAVLLLGAYVILEVVLNTVDQITG